MSVNLKGLRQPTDQRADAGAQQGEGTGDLRGRLGSVSVILNVLAFLSPLAAASGYIPLVIAFGNGLGTPVIFLVCGAIVAVAAVGFLAMVRQVPRPGAFYAYITAGLGKRVGLGSGALTLTFYTMSLMGFYILGSVVISSAVQDSLGLDLPWWSYTAIMLVVVAFCTYRGIQFNIRIIGVLVALEIAVILLFNLVTLFRGGESGHSAEPFSWDAFTSGPIAAGILFATAFFVGFESTAVYREEVRNPNRTIPRATYIVTGIISIFYCVTAYCLIIALGTSNALSVTSADPAGAFPAAAIQMVGPAFSQMVTVMVITSVLTAALSMTNAATRYVYSFGKDRVLPQTLGVVHKRHGSPHRAAVATNAILALGIIIMARTGMDPKLTYGIFSGVMVFGFQTLVLLVSLATIIYFRRKPGTGESKWATLIAPIISSLIFGGLLCFSFANLEMMVGSPTPLTFVLFSMLVTAFVAGISYAGWLARRRPDVYERIGRAAG